MPHRELLVLGLDRRHVRKVLLLTVLQLTFYFGNPLVVLASLSVFHEVLELALRASFHAPFCSLNVPC